MNEKNRLVDALAAHADSAWGKVALSAIADSRLVFAGNRDASAGSTAGDLLLIYRMRLEHTRERGIDSQGLSELIDCLARRPPDEMIEVHPFTPRSRPTSSHKGVCGPDCYDEYQQHEDRQRQSNSIARLQGS